MWKFPLSRKPTPEYALWANLSMRKASFLSHFLNAFFYQRTAPSNLVAHQALAAKKTALNVSIKTCFIKPMEANF